MGETYKSAADCPLGEAHGLASTHGNADGVDCCDFCGFPSQPSPVAAEKVEDDLTVVYLAERADLLKEVKALTQRLAEAEEMLRLFVGCAYPVSIEINRRGHNWSEAYLDGALPIARAFLAHPAGGEA